VVAKQYLLKHEPFFNSLKEMKRSIACGETIVCQQSSAGCLTTQLLFHYSVYCAC